MVKKPEITLGINPGTKYLGIAIFNGTDLRDWKVKEITGKWSKEKLETILSIVGDLMKKHSPDTVALKRINPSRSSPGLNRLVASIKSLCRRKRLSIREYSIKEMERALSPEKKINKKQLAEIMAAEYPILYNELNSEKSHKNKYYIRMFEAVALGAANLREPDGCVNKIINVKTP
jgi:Holliday junction resolvasome RuvABC endonuclease subunit